MKKYAIVGLGSRARMFQNAICKFFPENAMIVAVCDSNPGRLALTQKKLSESNPKIQAYNANDFTEMLKDNAVDTVIVCVPDNLHSEYICNSLKSGCDVITEKPMTIDETKCKRIIDTVSQTNKSVRVTFNYRYSPFRSQVKQLLMEGRIGRVLSVNFRWNLDTYHGADYFRRWHRHKKNSGGLLVHKSTHHFDLVNWWLGDTPKKVYAKGKRKFYTPKQAEKYGITQNPLRCFDCKFKEKCNFAIDLAKHEDLDMLYLKNEQFDGYFRDKCVFSNEIDIEDSANVFVTYQNGTFLNYSLNAFSPWEGYKIEFHGTKGKLEHTCMETSYINGDGTTQGEVIKDNTSIKIFPHFKAPEEIDIIEGEGGHGGGDLVLLNDLFGIPDPDPDPLKRNANHIQGAYSILVGIAANKSMETKKEINIEDLIANMPDHGYPINNTDDASIQYVPDAVRLKND